MSIDRLMNRIYTDQKDYRYAPDISFHPRSYGKGVPPLWHVYICRDKNNQSRIATLSSEEECIKFIDARCNPIETPPRVYPDICRCGISVIKWEYHRTGELIFERCNQCKLPMRHDVMVYLNKPLIEDFSLEDFLGI